MKTPRNRKEFVDALRSLGPSSQGLHAGAGLDAAMTTRAKTMPIYESSVFVYEGLAELDEFLSGDEDNYMYTRLGNPNQRALEELGAVMEGGEACHVCASGMAAIANALLAVLSKGDHLIATADIYGGTQSLFEQEFRRFGIEVDFINLEDGDLLTKTLRPSTKAIFTETASNPMMRISDIPSLARTAEARGIRLLVDNTFLSPALYNPLKDGAHGVVHSTTKYINGHSDATGGLFVADKAWVKTAKRLTTTLGALMTPLEAWLTYRGAKTLALRMERHSSNALGLAAALAEHPNVEAIFHPGLPGHPHRELASRLFPKGSGGMFSFNLRGGLDAADRFVRNLSFVKLAPSLAGVTTTLSHPMKTSHRGLAAEALEKLGIGPGTIRVSTGLEDPADLVREFTAALDR